MLNKSAYFAVFSLCCIFMEAQEVSQPGRRSKNDHTLFPHPMKVGIRHIENKGIGYNTGYTTLEMFLAPPVNEWIAMPFIDLRGHVFDDGKWAANGGLGIRKIYQNRVFGAYAYYDYRNTSRNNYNQFSFGLETLGNWWDIRLNGYLPFGDKKSSSTHFKFAGFSGNYALLSRKTEYALAGANGEFGAYIFKKKDFDLYGAAGPYYLKGEFGEGFWGGEVRIAASYKTWFAAEVNYSYDKSFGNIIQGQLAFNIPFGPRTHNQRDDSNSLIDKSLYNRMVDSVKKIEIIPVDYKVIKSAAVNPETESLYTFWFVDNSTNRTAGTFESPSSTLAIAEKISEIGDIIYVLPGDLTNKGSTAGIKLKNDQKLWGATIAHTLNTTMGTVEIPPHKSVINPNSAPMITNISGHVVTVANNNEISGIIIQNLMGNGIEASSINDLIIRRCTIQGLNAGEIVSYGIKLSNVQGKVLIDNNFISQAGVSITASNIQNSNYIISNNSFHCAAQVGANNDNGFFDFLYSNCENITTMISSNYFATSNASWQMVFDNTAPLLQACSMTITNNKAPSNFARNEEPLTFTLKNHANLNLSISNNILHAPYGDTVTISQKQNSRLNLILENNELTAWLSPLSISLANSAQFEGYISNNRLFFDIMPGIDLTAADASSSLGCLISNNKISGITQAQGTNSDAISIATLNCATATATISSNSTQSAARGVALETKGKSTMVASVSNNTITDSGLAGVHLTTGEASEGFWSVCENKITAPKTPHIGELNIGACVTANDSSKTSLNFTNNSVTSGDLTSKSSAEIYHFTNNSANFHLTSYSGNVGTLTETGVISKR